MKSARREPGARVKSVSDGARVEPRAREGRAGVRKCWPAVQSAASALGLSGRQTVIESQPRPGSLVPLAVGGGCKTLVPGLTVSEPLLGACSGCRTRGLFCGPWNTALHLVAIGEAGAPAHSGRWAGLLLRCCPRWPTHASSPAPSIQWEVSSSLLPSLGRGWSLVLCCKVQSSLFLCSHGTCHPLR